MSSFLPALEAAIATIANIWQSPIGTVFSDARTANLMKKSEKPEHYMSSDDAIQNSSRKQKS
jgi:hypothetical protein